jgi:hypothetical protein
VVNEILPETLSLAFTKSLAFKHLERALMFMLNYFFVTNCVFAAELFVGAGKLVLSQSRSHFIYNGNELRLFASFGTRIDSFLKSMETIIAKPLFAP